MNPASVQVGAALSADGTRPARVFEQFTRGRLGITTCSNSDCEHRKLGGRAGLAAAPLARNVVVDNTSMRELYRIEDRDLLIALLSGEGGFHGPAVALEGLTAEQALAKPHGVPHSIAEIVGHMCYWQEWFNRCAAEGFTGMAEHALEGWPAVAPDGWEALRTRYLAAIEEGKTIVTTSTTLNDPLLPPHVPIPFLAKESKGSGILHAVVHSGHHLGQIVTMRQLMGLWPPPAGSMTW